jgi:hypothetical protein
MPLLQADQVSGSTPEGSDHHEQAPLPFGFEPRIVPDANSGAESPELPVRSKVAASMDKLERRQSMEIVPLRSDPRPEYAHHVCNMCGKPSEITICDECSERLRVEALDRKKHEEQGNAWSHWE